jgi:hypothetical protein
MKPRTDPPPEYGPPDPTIGNASFGGVYRSSSAMGFLDKGQILVGVPEDLPLAGETISMTEQMSRPNPPLEVRMAYAQSPQQKRRTRHDQGHRVVAGIYPNFP